MDLMAGTGAIRRGQGHGNNPVVGTAATVAWNRTRSCRRCLESYEPLPLGFPSPPPRFASLRRRTLPPPPTSPAASMMTTAGTTFSSRHDRTRPPHSVCGSNGWSSQGIWRPPTWSTMSAAMEPAQRILPVKESGLQF